MRIHADADADPQHCFLSNVFVDKQHGLGHAAWTLCSMDINMQHGLATCSMDLHMQHGHGQHWTCSMNRNMDKDMYIQHGHGPGNGHGYKLLLDRHIGSK